MKNNIPSTHDVLLYNDGSIVEDLTIDQVSEGERDKSKNLLQEGGITFLTPIGKRFFLTFSQFSFVIKSPEWQISDAFKRLGGLKP